METDGKTGPLGDLAIKLGPPILLGALVAVLGTWLAAVANAHLFQRRALGAGLVDAARALLTPAHWSVAPAEAWPLGAAFGPAGTYWVFLVLFWGIGGAVLYFVFHKTREGPEVKARTRLGASTKEQFAELDDLDTLRVDGPTFGRFILGTADGQLVATEHRHLAPAKPPRGQKVHPRQGDINSVLVVGPSRSKKTVGVTAGVYDWMGPAVLSSVKGDLLLATIKHRRTVGEVRIYDPLGTVSGVESHRAGWTPLSAIHTLEAAQRETTALADAAPIQGVENGSYFVQLASKLVGPLLWVAAKSGRSMADVVRWVNRQDSAVKPGQGNPNPPAEVRTLLGQLSKTLDGRGAEELAIASDALAAAWNADDRTRSNTYTTAGLLLVAWESGGVREADTHDVQIDLDWLLDGPGYNTLYICTNVEEQERLAPVFGGMIASLVNEVYRRTAGTKPLIPPLLLVLDEAANTPNKRLPAIASTCAGLGVLMVTVWQSLSQIQSAFSRLAGDVITNHGTKLLFAAASDMDTLRYASDITGEEDVITMLDKDADREGPSESVSLGKLVPVGVLRRALPGTALMIHGTLPPVDLRVQEWWLDDRLHALSDGDGPDWVPRCEPGNPDAAERGLRRRGRGTHDSSTAADGDSATKSDGAAFEEPSNGSAAPGGDEAPAASADEPPHPADLLSYDSGRESYQPESEPPEQFDDFDDSRYPPEDDDWVEVEEAHEPMHDHELQETHAAVVAAHTRREADGDTDGGGGGAALDDGGDTPAVRLKPASRGSSEDRAAAQRRRMVEEFPLEEGVDLD